MREVGLRLIALAAAKSTSMWRAKAMISALKATCHVSHASGWSQEGGARETVGAAGEGPERKLDLT